MLRKKTDDCCRYCRHFGWGLTRKTQVHEQRVCLNRPKVYRDAIFNIQPHYYATRDTELCENFERKQ